AYLNGGVVQITAENNLGAADNDINFGGGTLNVLTGFTSGTGKIFNVTAGLSGVLDIASGQTLTTGSTGNLLTTGNSAATLFKSGSGTLVVRGSNSGFTGALQVNAGIVE